MRLRDTDIFAIKQFIWWEGTDCLFFPEIDHNIKFYLNDRKLVSGYLVSTLENSKTLLTVSRGVDEK